MFNSCFKIVGNDIRRNPVSYAALFIAAVVCAVVTLFIVRDIRSFDSTPYDGRYSFRIEKFTDFGELKEFYKTCQYKKPSYIGDNIIIGQFGKQKEVRYETHFSSYPPADVYICTAEYEAEIYPELRGGYNAYVSELFLETDIYGVGYKFGDRIEITGSIYTIVGVIENSGSAYQHSIMISKFAPPKGLNYETLRPLKLAFGRRLEQGELEYLSGLGFKNIPDANTIDYGYIAVVCLAALINIAFAAVISAKIIDNTIGGTARLRLLGGKRGAGAAVYAGTLNAIYIAGLIIALPIDGAISKWYKVYRLIDFGDALQWQDFAIVYGLLIAIYAAVSVGLAVKKTKNLAKNLKE